LTVGSSRKGKSSPKTMCLTLDDGSGEIEIMCSAEDQKYTELGDYVGYPVLVGITVANGQRTVVSVDVPASIQEEAGR